MSDHRPAPGVDSSARVYRVLLQLYSKSFRTAHAADAVDLFRDRFEEEFQRRGGFGLAVFWVKTLGNVIWHGVADRFRDLLDRRSQGGGTGFAKDLAFAAKSLRRSPGFTIGASATLALGIGATVTLYTLVDSVLLRPLPYPQADRIVQLWEANPALGLDKEGPSPWNFADWQRSTTSFDAMAAWYLTSGTYRDESRAEEMRSAQVTTGFFRVFGVAPQLGRDFVDAEGTRYGPVILSDRFWRRVFGGDPAVVGRMMELSGTAYEIAGVMPPGFDFPDPSVEYWLAWDLPSVYEGQPEVRTWRFLESAARLRAGVNMADAAADLAAVQRDLSEAFPVENRGWEARVTGLQDEVVGGVRGTLLVALGAVAVVLLLACANVANLILARSPARSRELAVRSALGAGRSRLARQLLIEHLSLSVVGSLMGLLLAVGMLTLVQAFGVGRIPRLDEVAMDGGVLAFMILLTGGTSLLFGLAPLVHLVRDPVARFVGGGSGRSVAGTGDGMRKTFVVVQVALALVLLVGASLFGESLNKLRQVDLGFDPQSTLTFRLSLDSRTGSRDGGGEGADYVSRYYDTLMDELLALPGAEAAGAATALPINPVTNDFTRPYRALGSSATSAEAAKVNMRMTTAGYFDAAGMRFLSGGPFNGLEDPGGPRVAVVNQTMASRVWPDRAAVGESIEIDFRDGWQSYRIVGVVDDVLHEGARTAATDEVFLSHVQIPYLAMSVVLRTSTSPQALVPSVRQTVLAHGPGQPPHNFVGFEELVQSSMSLERFLALLLGVFAGISLSLAAVGVYGVVAYAVTMRTRELGIRLALGAHANSVVTEIVLSASRTAALGLLVGAVLALLLGRGLESLLFEVAPTDPLTFVMVGSGLLVVAALAAFLSASRITRVDPLRALRQE